LIHTRLRKVQSQFDFFPKLRATSGAESPSEEDLKPMDVIDADGHIVEK
jgi:hypothetical protein